MLLLLIGTSVPRSPQPRGQDSADMSDVEENNFEGRVSGLPCAGHVEEGIGPEDGGWRCSAASGLAGVGAAQLGSKMAPSGARGLPGPWVTARVPLSCPRPSQLPASLPHTLPAPIAPVGRGCRVRWCGSAPAQPAQADPVQTALL